MPQLLSDLELDEVSLVKNAANGKKKFLIYKSDTKERVRKMTPPASPKAIDIQKAVDVAVQKALAGERRKTTSIRKELDVEKTKRRRAELAEIAKKKLSFIGPVKKTVDKLLAIENSDLPMDVKKGLIADLAQANEIKKQSDLYKSIGSNRPEPGTPTAEFGALVQKRLKEIRKSGNAGKSMDVLKAMAESEISRENPALARAVIAEERASAARLAMGVN